MKTLLIYLVTAAVLSAAPGDILVNRENAGSPKYTQVPLTFSNLPGAPVMSTYATGTALAAEVAARIAADQAINSSLSAYALISSLGTLATQNGTFSGTSSGTNTGDQDLSGYATTAALGSGLAGKQNVISFGTGIANALTINAGTNGAPVLMGAALGTPLSGNLANCTFPVLNQNTTGSAATLTTARTINGVSFNGSANIGQDLQTTASPTFAGVTINGGALFSAASTVATFTDTATSRSWRFVSGNLVPLSNGVGDLGGVSNRVANGYFVTINSSGTSSLGSGMSLTGSQAINVLDLSPTWNTTGNPSLIYGRVTNTASGASSNLIDLGTVAGGSLFKVSKFGELTTANYVSAGAGIQTSQGQGLSFSGTLFLYGEGSGILAQRNSTNAQTSRLYGTYTDTGNYRRLATTSTTGGRFTIAAQGAGTGASGNELVLSSPVLVPLASAAPSANGDLIFEATSNTTLTLKFKGADGVVRAATLTLAP